jgi:hypothetical protein
LQLIPLVGNPFSSRLNGSRLPVLASDGPETSLFLAIFQTIS